MLATLPLNLAQQLQGLLGPHSLLTGADRSVIADDNGLATLLPHFAQQPQCLGGTLLSWAMAQGEFLWAADLALLCWTGAARLVEQMPCSTVGLKERRVSKFCTSAAAAERGESKISGMTLLVSSVAHSALARPSALQSCTWAVAARDGE